MRTLREAGTKTPHADWVALYVSMGLREPEAEALLADREAARARAADETNQVSQA